MQELLILLYFLPHFLTGCDAPTPSDSEDEMVPDDALAPPNSSVNDLEPEDSPVVNDEVQTNQNCQNPRFGLEDRSFILQNIFIFWQAQSTRGCY